MKTLSTLFFALLVVSIAAAQTINADVVPQPVKSKLTEKYPDAKGVIWKQSDAGFVEATFSSGGKKIISMFNASGDWVNSDYEITKEEVPAAINQYLVDTKFAGYTTKYYKSESSAKGTQFSVDVKKGDNLMEFVFDEAGQIVMRGMKD